MPELRGPTGTPPRAWAHSQWLPLSLYDNDNELYAVLDEGGAKFLIKIRSAGLRPVSADLKVELFAVERATFEEDQFAQAPQRRELLWGQAVPDWAGALEAYWTCPVVPVDVEAK